MRGDWAALACVGGLWLLAGAAGAAQQRLGLRLEDAARHAREREAVRQTVVLRNDGATTLRVRLEWRTTVDAAGIEAGGKSLALPPGGETRTDLELRMPAARRAVRLRLALEARGTDGQRARLERGLRVYPERQGLPWAFLTSRRIGVYDPGGEVLKRLRELGGRPEAFPSPTAAGNFDGDLLVIGEAALRNEDEWRGFYEMLISRNAPAHMPAVVVLYQNLGEPERKDRAWTSIKPTAEGTGLFRELEADDLAGWREAGWVTRGPFPDLAGKAQARRCRVLAVAEERGSAERGGRSAEKRESERQTEAKAVLVEEAMPAGRVLLRCQVPLMARWIREPACELLLNALLRYGLDAKWKQEGKDGKNGLDGNASGGLKDD